MNTTTVDNTTNPVDAILSMVDTSPATQTPELSLEHRQRVEEAKKRAYYSARARGLSMQAADEEGQRAYNVEVELILKEVFASTPAPIQAPPIQPPPPPPPIEWVPVVPVPRPTPPSQPNIAPGQVDAVGAARSRTDADALIAAGFSPSDPVYERGSRVVAEGVRNARRSRIDHEKKPLVLDATTELIGRVRAEQRRIVVVPSSKVGMDDAGRIVATGCTVDGRPAGDLSVHPTRSAFGALTSRLGYSGADYLSRMPVKARANDVNFWRRVISGEDPEAAKEAAAIAVATGRRPVGEADRCAFRVRTKPNGNDEAFAVVSPDYSPFDCDVIADAIRRTCLSTQEMTTPIDGGSFTADLSQARGRVTYDGAKTRFEVMFHSNIQPEVYVAGEFFKAGVLVRTDDTGGGSCKVVPVVWQNRCLNLIIVEAVKGDEISIRHVGDVRKLTRAFESAFRKSLGRLGHFLKAWGYACKDDVIAASKRVYGDMPADIDKALPGLFNGILSSGLVTIPGKRKEVVDELVKRWHADDSGAKVHGLTRASLVNAFTRYAHEIHIEDPWAEDEIQRDAGRLLFGRSTKASPALIPYVSLEEIAETTSFAARMN